MSGEGLNLLKRSRSDLLIRHFISDVTPTMKILNYLGDSSLIIFIINSDNFYYKLCSFFSFVAVQNGLSAEGGTVKAKSLAE